MALHKPPCALSRLYLFPTATPKTLCALAALGCLVCRILKLCLHPRLSLRRLQLANLSIPRRQQTPNKERRWRASSTSCGNLNYGCCKNKMPSLLNKRELKLNLFCGQYKKTRILNKTVLLCLEGRSLWSTPPPSALNIFNRGFLIASVIPAPPRPRRVTGSP